MINVFETQAEADAAFNRDMTELREYFQNRRAESGRAMVARLTLECPVNHRDLTEETQAYQNRDTGYAQVSLAERYQNLFFYGNGCPYGEAIRSQNMKRTFRELSTPIMERLCAEHNRNFDHEMRVLSQFRHDHWGQLTIERTFVNALWWIWQERDRVEYEKSNPPVLFLAWQESNK